MDSPAPVSDQGSLGSYSAKDCSISTNYGLPRHLLLASHSQISLHFARSDSRLWVTPTVSAMFCTLFRLKSVGSCDLSKTHLRIFSPINFLICLSVAPLRIT